MAQRNTPDTLKTLRHLHDSNSRSWRGMCLKLQRSARNLPGVYPSALAAAQATPMSERVYDMDKMQAGMIAYSDDPNDGNPFGHIYCLRTRRQDRTWLTWTNDALVSGGVSCVDIDWFRRHWGDRFQFAATSLNGFDLLLSRKPELAKPSKHPEPPHRKKATKTNLDYAIHRVDKSIVYHDEHGHDAMVRALKAERKDIVALRAGKVPARFKKA